MFSTTAKVTTQGFVEAKLTVPLGDNFALQSAASYTVSKSNYAPRNLHQRDGLRRAEQGVLMMTALRALVPALALLLAAAPAAAQDVGVAAAVNQSALSVQPNTVVRTIGLGDNVIYNERIDTNNDGLVQLLLADGTTFTVGPNSSLVIDSFVYDPAAGTAQVAATLTKGVLRFIGAATSKTPDGVAITTPVGVVGIRGGVTDINMNPPAGIPPHISMIFGNSVTLTSGGQLLGRLFEAGYSLALMDGNIDTLQDPRRMGERDPAGAQQQTRTDRRRAEERKQLQCRRSRRGQFLADRSCAADPDAPARSRRASSAIRSSWRAPTTASVRMRTAIPWW